MVNQELLNKYIEMSGKKKTFLADKCGLTIQSFKRKITNNSDFRLTEVDILCRELNINALKVKEAIFFAKDVDTMTTSKGDNSEI